VPLNVSAGRRVPDWVVTLTLCPIDLAFPLHSGRGRVLDLHPRVSAAHAVRGATSLAHDAFTAKRTGVLVDHGPVAIIRLIDRNAGMASPQNPSQTVFAFLDRIPAQVRAIQFDQVECAQRRRVGRVGDSAKDRRPITPPD
jgi:hypothetical protein